MKRRLCLVLLLLCGGGAAAQTLQIRSGEHDGFTRLVIDIAPDTRWSLSPGAQGYDRIVKFPGGTFSFDTTGVFGRITTSRLSGLGAVAGTSDLGLKLACECGVEAFVLNQSMLVVDISEEFPAEPQPTKPQSRDIVGSASGDLPFLPQTQGPMTETLGVLPLDRLATWSGGEWANSAPSRSPVPDPLRAEIAGVERNITEQLALAVTSGVLDVSKVPVAPSEALISTNPAPEGPLGDPVPPQAGIPRVDAPRATLEDGRILLSGDNCIAEEDLALRDWAGDAPFDTQLRDLRQGLVGEFDRVDAAVAEKLAKFYLHHGMGPEAEVFINLASTPARPIHSALAALLDEKPDTTDAFSAQTHCDGSAALWSLLGLRDVTTSDEINTDAILRGYEGLPEPLKPYLASRLVDRLLEIGEDAAAQDLLKRVGRSETGPNATIELARAKIDIGQGDVETASSRLTEVARKSSGTTSAQAVETLMELSAQNGAPVATDISELASAYSVEFRDTEDGPGLWRAHMRALIGTGDFDRVFEEMNSQSSGDAHVDKEVRTEVADAMIRDADDVTFMRLALSQTSEHPLGEERSTVLAGAERILALGLPDAASRLIEKMTQDRGDRDARLLQSRILLAQGRPEDAEIALIGLQGPDALELRSEARVMMGDVDYARSALDAIGKPLDPTAAAWLPGDWGAPAEPTDSPGIEAGAIAPEADPANAPTTASLTGSKALVGESEATRETLRALLDATRIAPDS